MTNKIFKLKIQLPGKKTIEIEAQEGEKLTQALNRRKLSLKTTCGSKPSCCDCKIKIVKGGSDSISKMEAEEKSLLGNVFHITNERLGCQCHIFGELTIVPINGIIEAEKEP